MALWGGLLSRLQSETCKALWGITKFSEDALGTLGKTVGGVESGISTAINNTITGNLLNFGGSPGVPASQNNNNTASGGLFNTLLNPIQTGSQLPQNYDNNSNKPSSSSALQGNVVNPVTERSKPTTKKKPSLLPIFPIGL